MKRDGTGDFDLAVGCRCCALLETDEVLRETLEARGHRA